MMKWMPGVPATLLVVVVVCSGFQAEAQEKKAKSKAQKADLSTPKAAMATFLRAAVASDVELLSKCIAPDCAKEFAPLRDKKASKRDLKSLATMFEGAKIGAVESSKSSATVNVQLKNRKERIEMKKYGKAWKVVDF